MKSSNRSAGKCPACGAGIARAALDWDVNTQETLCPRGHRVARRWHGRARGFWTPEALSQPYGWSPWEVREKETTV